MLKSVFLRWFGGRQSASIGGGAAVKNGGQIYAKPLVIPKSRHGISRKRVSDNALSAVRRLAKGGYSAYIVGGAVRDLLRGATPKDFDLATSAPPSAVRRMFRNARVIGRRFKIVHLYFPGEVVEVSTFRAGTPTEQCEASGRILSDNTYGSERDDASRRDFTANALFFNPLDETIVDYVGGFEDVRRRRLRMIGEPQERYREDAVRILRAVRLAAKLDFTMARDTEAAIAPLVGALGDIPAARLFDELVKILKSGAASRAFAQMRQLGVVAQLLPHLASGEDERLMTTALEFSDKRVAAGAPVSISLLLAALFWPPVRKRWRAQTEAGIPNIAAMTRAMDAARPGGALITRRLEARLAALWMLQARMNAAATSRKRALAIMRDEGFRSARAFLRLRAAVGDADADIAKWWDEFADADSQTREKMLTDAAAATKAANPGGRRRRRRRRNGTRANDAAQGPTREQSPAIS